MQMEFSKNIKKKIHWFFGKSSALETNCQHRGVQTTSCCFPSPLQHTQRFDAEMARWLDLHNEMGASIVSDNDEMVLRAHGVRVL